MNGSNPLGRFGPFVAAIISIGLVGAAVIVRILAAQGLAQTDAWLDTAALIVVGVVLGVGAIGNTATSALAKADAANRRLDVISPSTADPLSPPPQRPGGLP